MPSSPRPNELDDVVAFVAGQQARPDRRIPYVGEEAAGIAAELAALAPPWGTTARVVRDEGGALAGVVVAEWDEDLGRSWIIGPWVAADDASAWARTAAELVDAALVQVPPGVTRHEMAGDGAHHRLADLAAARGWTAGEPNHLLVADAALVVAWPDDDTEPRPVAAGDLAAVAALHDAEFPDTYATATQLVEGGVDGSLTVLVAVDGDGGVVGYAAGRVHEDGEGYFDFVAVDPTALGRGVGRSLVVAVTRRLIAASPLGRVALTVQDHRAPARALYEALGFRPAGVLVGYRSWSS